ncbi:hypothetical protein XA68_15222 [Ophiocordyceps unilateralis]|uniref:Uncharacterized protein n=1 Tax=Ophiocordyceps unilateralis TaxID=268505 RepID=A0A2A9P7Z3_OPHUN|nr:hypothetical protein XA68_15222 [Ophiocordyceps unilateralis]
MRPPAMGSRGVTGGKNGQDEEDGKKTQQEQAQMLGRLDGCHSSSTDIMAKSNKTPADDQSSQEWHSRCCPHLNMASRTHRYIPWTQIAARPPRTPGVGASLHEGAAATPQGRSSRPIRGSPCLQLL